MGCGISQKIHQKNYSSILIQKLNTSLQRTRSNLTISTSLSVSNISRQPRCLNLRVLQSSNKLLRSHINLRSCSLSVTSLKYESDYMHISEAHKKFLSVTNYFFSLVHEVCFQDFSVQDGIFIMLIMIFTQPKVKVKFLAEKPFFQCQEKLKPETEKLVKAWEELIEFLIAGVGENLAKLEKALVRISNFIGLMHERLESELRPRKISKVIAVCEDAIAAGKKMIRDMRIMMELIYKFFKGIENRLEEIRQISRKCDGLEELSADRIVHFVLGNN